MRGYAWFAVLHWALLLAAMAGLLGPMAGLVILGALIPLLFAWGPFQADVALNSALENSQRSRWRIALWLVPWTMAIYWHRHVRPRHALD